MDMKSDRKRAASILIAVLIQIVACFLMYGFDVPNPNIFLFVLLSAALVQFGYLAGVCCGVVTLAYSLFYFSTNHDWITFTSEKRNKILMLILALIANILVIGKLLNRSRRDAESIARLELEKQKAEEVAKYSIALAAISKIYCQVFRVNLVSGNYEEISTESNGSSGHTRYAGEASRDFPAAVNRFVGEAYKASMTDFLALDTLPQRLSDVDTVSAEFCSQNGKWIAARYIAERRDVAGAVTQVLFLLQHIDEQKRKELDYQKQLEETTREAQRANQAKTEFLRRMSHDIRTPLNGIIGLLKIDEAHFQDADLVLENHKKMTIAANHLLSLINDVLEMSKLEDGRTILTHEVISLVALTQDIRTIIAGRAVEAGIIWDYEKGKSVIPYPYPYIYGSPVHLRQIFLNIYGNCIKYNRPNGKITTIVDVVDEKDGVCTYRWTISDTGVGMSQEFLEHIFDPFAQEKKSARSVYQGTGLGMAIVKGLLDQMGGTISITSQEGVGSTFVIAIPFEIAPAPDTEQKPESPERTDIHGLRLLLAEDNELNAEIAEVLLEDCGALVSVVSDGKKALDLFRNSPKNTYDAILMDIMMPEMDGIAATKAIRNLDRPDAKTIPIVAMTANAFAEDVKRCRDAGMNAHVAKPIDMAILERTLKNLTAGSV